MQGIRAWDNSYGVVVSAADSTVVTGNTLYDNLADGVRVFSGQNVQITNNFLRENTDDGVFVQAAAPSVTITGKKAISNGSAGIDVDGPNAHVTGNVANGNTTDGEAGLAAGRARATLTGRAGRRGVRARCGSAS